MVWKSSLERKLKMKKYYFLILILLFQSSFSNAISSKKSKAAAHRRPFIQSAFWEDYSGTGYGAGINVSFAKNITPGNFVLVFVTWNNTSARPTTVWDGTNTFTEVASAYGADAGNGQWQTAYYYANHPGGTSTIYATWGFSRSYTSIQVVELQRIDNVSPINCAISQTQGTPGTAANAISSGGCVTNAATVVLGLTQATTDLSGTVTAGTSFTKKNTSNYAAFEYAQMNSTGSKAITFTTTSSSNSYITSLVALKMR